jgi:hypothetical protein
MKPLDQSLPILKKNNRSTLGFAEVLGSSNKGAINDFSP